MQIISSNIRKRQSFNEKMAIVKRPILGRLVVPNKGKSLLLKVQEIVYCQAAGNYTTIHMTDDRSVLCAKCLKDVMAQLPLTQFVRTHQSFVVNVLCIEAVGQDAVDIIQLAKPIPLSRRYGKLLRGRLLS